MNSPSIKNKYVYINYYTVVDIALIACRYADGTVKLRNPNIELMDQDILYHVALGSESHDLREMFGDVKVSVEQALIF